ncbi:2-oxoglutarate dehydrogenase complex E2 component, partial [Coemansia sp. RSA 2603]
MVSSLGSVTRDDLADDNADPQSCSTVLISDDTAYLLPHFRTLNVADSKYRIIKVPHMADSITEGTLKSWAKQVGEQVEQDEEVASIETDKVDIPVNSPVSGVLREFLANEEDTV